MIDIFMANDILEEANITYEEYDLQEKFDDFNKKYFDNKLPKVPLSWDRSKAHTGICRFMIKREDQSIYGQTISLSKLFKRDELTFDKILIHEMIHLWNSVSFKTYPEYRKNCGNDGHGHLFQERVAILSKKFGHQIPLRDDITDIESMTSKPKELDYMIVNHDHRVPMIAVFKKGALLEHIDEFFEGARYFMSRYTSVIIGRSNAWQLTAHYKGQLRFFGSKSIKFSAVDHIKDSIFPELVEMGKRIK